jgi:hypothetical protein
MKIKNWTKFQHFKDRRPPWVKLYRDILDDLEWHELDPLAAKVLIMLWLIASENDGCIPDNKTLAFRLRLTEVKTKEIVIKLSHWLEHDDINAISEQYQCDSAETERETEKERETKTAIAICPINVDEQVWSDFLALRKVKKAPMTVTALAGIKREADKANWSLDKAISECVARGWTGFKADWVAEKANRFDVVLTTTPPPPNQDAALKRIMEDDKKAVPPSLEVLARMAEVRRKA